MLVLSHSIIIACINHMLLGHMLLKTGAESHYFLLSQSLLHTVFNKYSHISERTNEQQKIIQCLISHSFKNLDFILKSELFLHFCFCTIIFDK